MGAAVGKPGQHRRGARLGLVLALLSAVTYVVLSYGGIRSPDSEVVYRTAEALSSSGTFAVGHQLPWTGFGLPHGVDGRRYSLFGPLESIAAVPLVGLAHALHRDGLLRILGDDPPYSHYLGTALVRYAQGVAPLNPVPHAERSLVVLVFNPAVCALGVWLLYSLMLRLTGSVGSSALTALLFAFGSLWLPYSGTFFSEPLATVLCLASFALLATGAREEPPGRGRTGLAGLMLGAAATAHITALLFAPFFAGLAAVQQPSDEQGRSRWLEGAAAFAAGLAVPLALLGWYNQARFGNFLQTGRTVPGEMAYSQFVPPFRGLYGLLVGPSKGILWFCPVVIAALLCWPAFHRRYRRLSLTIVAAALFRLLFIASRSDWHGGFCLGPRYLVMLLPLLLVPVGVAAASWDLRSWRSRALRWVALPGFVAQQVYFSTGEIFMFYHVLKWRADRHGIDPFKGDAIYLDWHRSPLFTLLSGRRGPWDLQLVPLSNAALWAIVTLMLLAAVFLCLAWAERTPLREHG